MNSDIIRTENGFYVALKECVRITSDDSNRCINCGAKAGHKCEISNYNTKN